MTLAPLPPPQAFTYMYIQMWLNLHWQVDIAVFDFQTMSRYKMILQLVISFVSQFTKWTGISWFLAAL